MTAQDIADARELAELLRGDEGARRCLAASKPSANDALFEEAKVERQGSSTRTALPREAQSGSHRTRSGADQLKGWAASRTPCAWVLVLRDPAPR
jgi:hypothetical protein